jgi:hypothetical protein
MAEGRHSENLEGEISVGKRLIEDRTRQYAQAFDIDSRRLQVGWYRIPGQLSMNPYIFAVSTDGRRRPEECRFSEQELESFAAGNNETGAKLRALVNELKKNTKGDSHLKGFPPIRE